ncbi:mitochondrial solute carrier family 25 (mitochondrial carnitine/acylcarnitine transporter) member 20/29 [Andalucia godoyi]|uniref:Mitochondrial solute carrier family 25 (Mitochondrial carnitine/acylcarnitine transporter) member 20/29 n=1 Tax=Andalucia godoyi TaxID=505711 RepID=A0A8K0AH77_ANDGO|nr:mitochondrial solute carrier family 25 (mitochondrial carnitine/acylcarnitine transporter) member 20/29 [Andalucia godoyi]|eukprot:ANDGO_06890.mRNA.1 mitochondrial solute carrier family 25 (mitochondrial carnitine/acylcarnitine transporter) member 20/29
MSGLDAKSIGIHAAAGLYGGIGLCLVGHPFEVAKTRLQVRMYPDVRSFIKGTFKNEGLPGFYAGVASPLALSMVFRGWLYVAFHLSRNVVPKDSPYAAGGMTGFLAAFVESPMLLLANQCQTRPKTSVVTVLREIVSQHGVSKVFTHGLSANIVRNIPSNACYLGTFHVLREKYHMNAFAAGSIGGVSYWMFTYPLDAIRGCIHGDSLDPTKRKYSGWMDAAKKLWKDGGIKRFYRGYSVCMARAIPANGTFFFMAEQAKAYLLKN